MKQNAGHKTTDAVDFDTLSSQFANSPADMEKDPVSPKLYQGKVKLSAIARLPLSGAPLSLHTELAFPV